MPNEVVIIVKARNDTRAVFDRIRQESRDLGDDMGTDVTTNFSRSFGQNMRREAGNQGGNIASIGDTIGETIGRRVSERVTERINRDVNERLRDGAGRGGDGGDGSYRDANGRLRGANGRFISGAGSGGAGGNAKVDVDVDRQSLLGKMAGIGQAIAGRVSGALSSAVSTFFSGDFLSIILKTLSVGALAAVLLPTFGAAIGAVLLTAVSGGALAAGIAAALKDPKIMAEVKAFGARVKDTFSKFGDFFKPAIGTTLEGLGRVLEQMRPLVDHLGAVLGPVAEKLGAGVVGFLQNFLPALTRFAENGAPLIETLADELPGIGDALGDMFDAIGAEGDSANAFWNDFLNIIQLIIRTVGHLIANFAEMYGFARTVFKGLIVTILDVFGAILAGADIAFGWVPGIGPKLSRARKQFAEFKAGVNRELKGIDDVDVTVRIRQVFSVVGNAVAGVGAILSRRAAGGISGAASGGIRNGMTWVGEHGPELVQLPAGSSVKSNPDSMRMAGQSTRGGGPLLVQLLLDGRVLAQQLLDPQREIVNSRFGGNVQSAYGRAY